jgi:RHS repeat-associated protein
LTSSAGAVTDEYLFDSFGNVLSGSGGTTNPFQFVGRLGYYADADTGAYYVRARIYDPRSARFVSKDPASFASGDANLYRYAAGNPVTGTDPSGLVGYPPPNLVPYTLSCFCAYLRRRFIQSQGGATAPDPTQQACINSATSNLQKVTGNSYSDCASNMVVGGQGFSQFGTTWTSGFCGVVTILHPNIAACGSCSSFVTLLTTIVHECIHQGQSSSMGVDEAECAALSKTANMLASIGPALCGAAVGDGMCGNQAQCMSSVNQNRQTELTRLGTLKGEGLC